MPHLEDWSVVMNPDASPYTPPERHSPHLHGKVWDHPSCSDSREVTTSRLIMLDVRGRVARTRSGSHYTLGKPNSAWVAWLAKSGKKLEDYGRSGDVSST